MFWGQVVCRLDLPIAILAGVEIERYHGLATAAFPGPQPSPLIGEEVFDRPEKEGAKLAALRIGDGQVVLGQQPNKELLGQVLGIFGRKAGPPHKGIQWKPIILAKRGQGMAGLGGLADTGAAALPGGADHHAPVCCCETVATSRQPLLLFAVVTHSRILGPAEP